MDDSRTDAQETAAAQPAPEAGEVAAWEQVEAGRFMPRRVRGSCRGLALG